MSIDHFFLVRILILGYETNLKSFTLFRDHVSYSTHTRGTTLVDRNEFVSCGNKNEN